jgi:outer membrane protein assembly factor BamB
MTQASARHLCFLLALIVTAHLAANGQTASPAASGTNRAWTINLKGDIRWQQVTPAGALLVSTDAALAAIDTDRGLISWQKPELGGVSQEEIRAVDDSLLMKAERPGLLLIFDPVTGAVVFDSRKLNLTEIVTCRVLPQSGTLLVHGKRAAGAPVVALYDLVTGEQRWANEGLFEQAEPKKRGLGALMQNLVRSASEGSELQVLQAGPDMIVIHTLIGLRALDAHTGGMRWSAELPKERFAYAARHVRLYPSVDKADRIYVSFDDKLMAYRLADGQALWATPPKVDGRIRDIVQHPAGIVMLPEAAPENEAHSGTRRVVNGVVQTGLNVARYEDGATIAAKPVRMHGNVTNALIAGDSVVLAVDAESRTFVNVLDVASATLRLKKDAKIKGQLNYAELIPSGLLYVSRPDATTNAEVNIIDLVSGEPKFKDAIESGKPLNADNYDPARYYLHHAAEGPTLYVFANRDHKLYAVDRQAGTFGVLGSEIKLQGGEDPTEMEIREAGVVLISPQNLVLLTRQGQIKQQVYYPAPQLPGLVRALSAVNAVRAGLYGAAASAYGDAFAQASQKSTDPSGRYVTAQLATAYSQAGAQLTGYSRQSAALATKRFKASLTVPSSVFMLTHSPDGNGNVLLQIDKDTAQPRARIDLGKERQPVYAVDDIAGMLFLRTAPGTLVGYHL